MLFTDLEVIDDSKLMVEIARPNRIVQKVSFNFHKTIFHYRLTYTYVDLMEFCHTKGIYLKKTFGK